MKLLVSALDHSANIHLGSLRKALSDDVRFIGLFDRRYGKPIADLQGMSVMGFVDAVKKIGYFMRLNDEMVELAAEADKILLMDSSAFNMPLAKKIKRRYPEKEIIYYILPQAWAWKRRRIPVLEKTVDRLASILPFERDYYSSQAPIRYVGHPLLDIIPRYKDELSDRMEKIVFLPGSRKGEIRRLMPVFEALARKFPRVQKSVVVPRHFSQVEINELYGKLTGFKVVQEAHKAIYEADFAFVCSGTATLETALIGTPFVLSYIAKPLDYFIARKLVKLSHIGLSNILFEAAYGRTMHEEAVQDAVTPEGLYRAFERTDRARFLEDSKRLRAYLSHGSSRTVAAMIEEKDEN